MISAGSVPSSARKTFFLEQRLLRDVALGGLDARLFERPTSGFVLPIERWCRERLSDQVGELLNDARTCADVGLQPAAVARL
jgi:asparagine synthase (glutamine-hydrolysing)